MSALLTDCTQRRQTLPIKFRRFFLMRGKGIGTPCRFQILGKLTLAALTSFLIILWLKMRRSNIMETIQVPGVIDSTGNIGPKATKFIKFIHEVSGI